MLICPRFVRFPALGQCGPGDRLGDETAVSARVDRTPQLRGEARLAVRGQRHDLVFVAGAQEPEVLRGLLVEKAERVRQELARENLQLASGIPATQMRNRLAATVADQDAA